MIKHYIKGYPCKITNGTDVLLGRITGEDESGQWGDIGNTKMFSIPLFTTPHGSTLKTGLFHLEDLEDVDWEKLENFEKTTEKDFYGGKLTIKEIKTANKLAKTIS